MGKPTNAQWEPARRNKMDGGGTEIAIESRADFLFISPMDLRVAR
jgi:hypothetical protein